MKMKNNLVVLLVLLLIGVSVSAQSDEEYTTALNEMFKVSGSAETYNAAIDQMFQLFQNQYTDLEDLQWEELKKEFQGEAYESLKVLLLPVYKKHLTLEDLKGAIAFYKSPAGVNLAKSTPLITQESMLIGQQWGMQIGEKFAEKMKEKGY